VATERVVGGELAPMKEFYLLALEDTAQDGLHPVVRLIKERGVSYTQASQDLGVHQSQLRGWVKALADDPQHAFPGQGQMKPEQLEIAQLKREVIRLKAERDILKKAAAYFAKEST
jgi:transposase